MSLNYSTPQNGSDISTEIYSLGSAVPLSIFQVCIGLIFGLACTSVVARYVMRYVTRRPLYWDDLFLGIGVACLIVATGLLYTNLYNLYLLRVLLLYPELGTSLSLTDLEDLLHNGLPKEYAIDSLLWTTIFCVKASFLVVSRQLMLRLPWMNVYFWIITVFTSLSWVFFMSSPFFECPYYGIDSVNCAIPSRKEVYVIVTGLTAALDILTDLLVVSIPIIILRRSKLCSKQKFIVGAFLSLSLILIIFAIIRISRIQASAQVDMGWLGFWQYLEAGIAVIVTSITTIRTVFTAHKARKAEQANSRSSKSASSHNRGTTKTDIESTQQSRNSLQPRLNCIMVETEVKVSSISCDSSIAEVPQATDLNTTQHIV